MEPAIIQLPPLSSSEPVSAPTISESAPESVPMDISPVKDKGQEDSPRKSQKRYATKVGVEVCVPAAKQTEAHHTPEKTETKVDHVIQQDVYPQDTATSKTDRSTGPDVVLHQSTENREKSEGRGLSTVGDTVTEPEPLAVGQPQLVEHRREEDILEEDEIEQEVISQDLALGHLDEYIVVEGAAGQYVRPPKRVSLAEYKRRRTTVDDTRQRRDSTGSESSQAASDREQVYPVHPTLVTHSDRTAASSEALPSDTESSALKSMAAAALSEPVKADVSKTHKKVEKPVQPVSVGDSKMERDTVVKEKESATSSAATETSAVPKQLMAQLVGPLTLKEHSSSSSSLVVSPSSVQQKQLSEQSKDSTSTVQSIGAGKVPTSPSYISSRVTQHRSIGSAHSSLVVQPPTFLSLIHI